MIRCKRVSVNLIAGVDLILSKTLTIIGDALSRFSLRYIAACFTQKKLGMFLYHCPLHLSKFKSFSYLLIRLRNGQYALDSFDRHLTTDSCLCQSRSPDTSTNTDKQQLLLPIQFSLLEYTSSRLLI